MTLGRFCAIVAEAKHQRAERHLSVLDVTSNDWDWHIEVPETVTLQCPQCGAEISCEVEIDGHVLHAEIETESCEDCGKKLCPKCTRYPHPDDGDLIQCPGCHAAEKTAVGAA